MPTNAKEIWKDIKGYERLYQISNFGRIKTFKRQGTNERILNQEEDRCGYLYVRLLKEYKYIMKSMHRLVAIHFIDNIHNKIEVNHIDGNKKNNNALNLEWVTHSENIKHAYMIGLLKPVVHSDETKARMSENRKGEKHPLYNKHRSNETIEKFKLSCKRGENNHFSKLNNWDVKFIKVWLSLNYRNVDIAKAFNIDPSQISKIRNNKYWVHVK